MNNIWGTQAGFEATFWPWPIALYLFLAGLSAGCALVSLLMYWYHKGQNANSNTYIKAGALLAPITIVLGLVLLIVDLGKPFSFYLLLIKYNFASVMSIGIIILCLYVVFAMLWAIHVFAQEIKTKNIPILGTFDGIVSLHVVRKMLFIFAIGTGAYTGFLLFKGAYIMWTSPILPVLFLVSGFSSGAALIMLASRFCPVLKKDCPLPTNDGDLHVVHKFDTYALWLELVLIGAYIVGIFSAGSAGLHVGTQVFCGEYFFSFWVLVVGVGILYPLINSTFGLTKSRNDVIINSLAVLIGVIALRFFIVYAGQAHTGL